VSAHGLHELAARFESRPNGVSVIRHTVTNRAVRRDDATWARATALATPSKRWVLSDQPSVLLWLWFRSGSTHVDEHHRQEEHRAPVNGVMTTTTTMMMERWLHDCVVAH
jgi:hypothetical protein